MQEFYTATGGDDWINNENWLSELPLNDWHGIATDEQGNVFLLDLPENNLSGPIPTLIGQMTELVLLDLSGNNLSGEIPDELANLYKLDYFNLASNKLTGEFPAWVGDLHMLDHLILDDNQLTGDVLLSSDFLGGMRAFSVAGNEVSACLSESLRGSEGTDVFSVLNYCNEPPIQPPISPPFIKWEVGNLVRLSEGRAAGLGVQWLFEYAESIGWPIVGDDVTVYFMTDDFLARAAAIEDGTIVEGEIESLREFIKEVGGFARGDSNFNRATGHFATIDRHRLFRIAELLIHENIHTAFQFDLEGLYTSPSLVYRHGPWAMPAWFTEGMASYFGALITSIHSDETDFLRRDGEAILSELQVSKTKLSSAEGYRTCEYRCGALAIELLASIVGQRHIVDFYTLRRPGRAWQETFEEVFGISVPDFYALYNQHRIAGFPELSPPMVPVGNDTENEQHPDDPGDRAALVAFYNATNGDSWDDNTNWLSDQPLATWHGISINSNGRVQGISLSENGLQGILPAEIGDLTNLKWLFLNGNEIRGEISDTITQLTNLEDLWLGENQLGGAIPEGMDSMTNLQYLALDDNDISGGLPATMMSMSNLRYLDLQNNDLAGAIPDNVGDMKSLEVLNLIGNQLTQPLPDSIGELSNLRELLITSNRLSGIIPESLGNLTNLETIDISDNRLSGHLPTTLGNLINLEYLYLTGNRISGTIPDEYSNMDSLIDFQIPYNQLIGQFPAWLSEIANASSVYLAGNDFNGCIPDELFDIDDHDLNDIPLPRCN